MLSYRSVLGTGRRFRIAVMALVCAFLLTAVLVFSARAEDGLRVSDLSDLQVCDLSGCYIVLQVVDSDGDGVCDADEILLGYDPLDPASTPPLHLLLESAIGGKLPTYELGYGTWVLYPEEFLTVLEKNWYDMHPTGEPNLPTQIFGIDTRVGTLGALGVYDDMLKDFGLGAPWKSGFTVGLTATDASGQDLGIDLGRFNGSWYSAHDNATAPWAAKHGGVKTSTMDGAERKTGYRDGTSSITSPGTPGCGEGLCTSSFSTKYYSNDLEEIGSSTFETWDDLDGNHHSERRERDEKGNVTRETHTTKSKDGKTITTETTDYQRDSDGNVTSSSKTTTTTTKDDKGKKTTTTTKQKCDAKGQNCTDGMTTGEDAGHVALPGAAWLSHQEAEKALQDVFTMMGTNVTPVQDAPSVIGIVTDRDIEAIKRRRDLISLFAETDYATTMVIWAGWNTAQPETRPDLPNPREGAPGGPAPGGCAGNGTC